MSVVVIVLPKLEDAKKIRQILMGHGFPQVFAYATASAALSEIREHESGMVISGYHLKDMYYTELADSLPPHFELVLLGSASTVSAADTGILSLTTPLKVYDLVNTAEMVLHQMERMAKKARKPKRRSEREEKLYKKCESTFNGTKPSDRRGGPSVYSEKQYGQWNQHGRDRTDDSDLTV